MLEGILSFLHDGHYCKLIRTELMDLFKGGMIRFHLSTGYQKDPTFLNLNMLDLKRVPRIPLWGPQAPTVPTSFGIALGRMANGPQHWPGANHTHCTRSVMFQLGNTRFGDFRGRNKDQTKFSKEKRCARQAA